MVIRQQSLMNDNIKKTEGSDVETQQLDQQSSILQANQKQKSAAAEGLGLKKLNLSAIEDADESSIHQNRSGSKKSHSFFTAKSMKIKRVGVMHAVSNNQLDEEINQDNSPIRESRVLRNMTMKIETKTDSRQSLSSFFMTY